MALILPLDQAVDIVHHVDHVVHVLRVEHIDRQRPARDGIQPLRRSRLVQRVGRAQSMWTLAVVLRS